MGLRDPRTQERAGSRTSVVWNAYTHSPPARRWRTSGATARPAGDRLDLGGRVDEHVELARVRRLGGPSPVNVPTAGSPPIVFRNQEEGIMKDEKRTNPPEPSRRNFLKASAAGAVLTLGAGCAAMGCAVIART